MIDLRFGGSYQTVPGQDVRCHITCQLPADDDTLLDEMSAAAAAIIETTVVLVLVAMPEGRRRRTMLHVPTTLTFRFCALAQVLLLESIMLHLLPFSPSWILLEQGRQLLNGKMGASHGSRIRTISRRTVFENLLKLH